MTPQDLVLSLEGLSSSSCLHQHTRRLLAAIVGQWRSSRDTDGSDRHHNECTVTATLEDVNRALTGLKHMNSHVPVVRDALQCVADLLVMSNATTTTTQKKKTMSAPFTNTTAKTIADAAAGSNRGDSSGVDVTTAVAEAMACLHNMSSEHEEVRLVMRLLSRLVSDKLKSQMGAATMGGALTHHSHYDDPISLLGGSSGSSSGSGGIGRLSVSTGTNAAAATQDRDATPPPLVTTGYTIGLVALGLQNSTLRWSEVTVWLDILHHMVNQNATGYSPLDICRVFTGLTGVGLHTSDSRKVVCALTKHLTKTVNGKMDVRHAGVVLGGMQRMGGWPEEAHSVLIGLGDVLRDSKGQALSSRSSPALANDTSKSSSSSSSRSGSSSVDGVDVWEDLLCAERGIFGMASLCQEMLPRPSSNSSSNSSSNIRSGKSNAISDGVFSQMKPLSTMFQLISELIVFTHATTERVESRVRSGVDITLDGLSENAVDGMLQDLEESLSLLSHFSPPLPQASLEMVDEIHASIRTLQDYISFLRLRAGSQMKEEEDREFADSDDERVYRAAIIAAIKQYCSALDPPLVCKLGSEGLEVKGKVRGSFSGDVFIFVPDQLKFDYITADHILAGLSTGEPALQLESPTISAAEKDIFCDDSNQMRVINIEVERVLHVNSPSHRRKRFLRDLSLEESSLSLRSLRSPLLGNRSSSSSSSSLYVGEVKRIHMPS
jgi:hypothetical protein